jgi:hypothetical protein
MLLHSKKRIPLQRVLSLLLVGFMVLASARGLVPSICLTMSAAVAQAEADAAACHAGTGHSCCTDQPSQPGKPPVKESDHCAFCHLAKAYTEAPILFEHPLWQEQPAMLYGHGPGAYHGPAADDRTLGRAPPAFIG